MMLGTMVTSWYFKNICYAQQGLLCVPVCHNLDRKGEEAEMATAISLLTYSNTFNIKQKVSNRQRSAGLIHSLTTTTPSLCAHTPKHFCSLRTKMQERDREVSRVHCEEKSTVTKQWPPQWSGSTGSSTSHSLVLQISAEGKCFTYKSSFCSVCWV